MSRFADEVKSASLRRLAAAMGAMYHPKRPQPRAPVLGATELRAWMLLPWRAMIAGFAVGEKRTGHAPTGELCLRLYVRRKVAKGRLRSSDCIPDSISIPQGKARIQLATDVVEMPSDPVAQRDLEAGASIGSFTGITDGTFGLAVEDINQDRFLLTCSHVVLPWFRNPPLANPDAVESPPDSDGSPGPNTIGALFSWTPLVPDKTHTCDAALVAPVAAVTLSNTPLQLNVVGFESTPPSLGLMTDPCRRVQTYTRRRVLNGVIQSIHNNFAMTFLGKSFFFREAVEVLYDSPSIGGDSGSAVVQSSTRQVLGLHFAALDGTNTGYYVPMGPIVKAFSAMKLRPL